MPDQYGNYNGTFGVPSPTPAPPASIPGPGGALVAGIAAGQNIAGKAIEAYRGGQQYQEQQQTNRDNGNAIDSYRRAHQSADSPDGPTHMPSTGAAPHPSVLDAISHGVRGALTGLESLFSGGNSPAAPAAPAAPAPAAPMSRGGAVTGALPFATPVGRADTNTGSTGQTFEPRLAAHHNGVTPKWAGAARSAAGGDGGAMNAPGDDIHPPGDSAAATKILSMDDGGSVPSGPAPVEKPTYADAVKDRVKELASKYLGGGMLGDTINKTQDHNARNAEPMDAGGVVTVPNGVVPPNQTPDMPGGEGTDAKVIAMDGGGAIPGPGGALVAGVQAGQNIANSAVEASRGSDQYGQQQDARKDFAAAVDAMGKHLHDHALNDAGVANKDQAMPVPADVAPSAGPTSSSPAPVAGAAPADAPPPAPAAGTAPADAPPPAAAGGPAGAAPPAPGAIPNPPTPPAPDGQPAPEIKPADAAAAAATQTVASDPATRQGIPQQSAAQSGQPHSLGPDFWDESQRLTLKAVASAARAGEDPQKAYEALNAVRNGFFSANVTKNLAAANVALQAGNMDAVEKAMKNVYYYFPDGKELTVKRDANGTVMYQDPITPFVDKDGNPTSAASVHGVANQPNMVPITAQHLQLLGEAALNPEKVGQTIASMRAAAVEAGYKAAEGQAKLSDAQANMLKAGAAEVTARGNLLKGEGINFEGRAKLQQVAADNYLHMAEGKKALAGAEWLKFKTSADLKGQKMDPATTNQIDLLDKQFREAQLGRPMVAPDILSNGSPNLANAGKITYDSSKIHPTLKNASPEQVLAMHQLAASLIAANGAANMPAARAMQLAITAFSNGDGKPAIGTLPDGSRTLHVPRKPDADPKNAADWDNIKIGDATAGTIQRNGSFDLDPAEVGLIGSLVSEGKSAIPNGPSVNSVAARAEPDAES